MPSQPGPKNQGDQAATRAAAEVVLGYLNFSSGKSDANFLSALNALFANAEGLGWRHVHNTLKASLASQAEKQSALGDCQQASAVVDLVFNHVLPGYRKFHDDLLFHQSDDELFRPLFIGRVCEAVLTEGPPWDEVDRIHDNAIARLNDYVGYRPVPALQSHRHEPYPHEWIRPVPLYIEGATIGVGRYHDVVQIALEIIRNTEPHLLQAAHLNPEWLSELAFDPRAYDFDHPANKRPNYHFGQWDPHCIDNDGRYRRLVVQQVTLDALMERVENPGEISPAEALREGGAVLAGVMLMATGISGWGPEALDSSVSLGNLLPHIAAYRDAFYQQLLEQTPGEHGDRLREEAARMRQPFAAARQELNMALTRRRATQIAHVQLAKVYAAMGFAQQAHQHASEVPSTTARISCRIACALSQTDQAIEAKQLGEAVDALAEIEQLLYRGVDCGAIIDPWSILGFDAHFSLFPAMENSIHDFRADELAELIDHICQRYTALWCAAAAAHDQSLEARVSEQLQRLTTWWHQFATHEVSSIESPNGALAYEAAQHVAGILGTWHNAGAAGGDIRFWAPHAQLFETPKAYATVVEALLDRRDYVASKALLVHWLSRAEETGLEEGESSFSALAVRWLRQLQRDESFDDADENSSRWALTKHLFDMFEANAEQFGEAPQLMLGQAAGKASAPEEHDEFDLDEDEEDNIYSAAYEEVVYRDSTDDGFEGELFDYGQPSEDELEAETKRISLQLGYLTTLAQLWKLAAWQREDRGDDPRRRDDLLAWFSQAERIMTGLSQLLANVAAHHIESAGIDCQSLVEFDRQKTIQEALLERVAMAHVEVADAAFFVLAAAGAAEDTTGGHWDWPFELSDEGRLSVSLMAAVMQGDRREAQARCAEYIEAIQGLPLLYIPISRGGDPHQLVRVRRRQRMLQNLAFALPRIGLLSEARQIVEVARHMERDHPVGPGAVTEFDDLFDIAYRAIIDCILHSSLSWWERQCDIDETAVFALLEHITRPMNNIWDAHSRTLRLSVLERTADEKTWEQIVEFIKQYGSDLFTQHFLNLGNIRAIEHQGVEQWLDEVEENASYDERPKMFDALGDGLSRRRATKCLTIILDAIAENYVEYRDYNATRTESDRGEELYKLLDFLRLRVEYDLVAWRYRPVMIAHELLLSRGRPQAAELFRRGLAKCTRDEANRFMTRLGELEDEHAMAMPTVAEKLAERFVQPTIIHRLCSLVETAIEQRKAGDDSTAFNLLQQEANVMARDCGGVGLDIPPWLLALEDEVQRVKRPHHLRDEEELLADTIGQIALTQEELEELLSEWSE